MVNQSTAEPQSSTEEVTHENNENTSPHFNDSAQIVDTSCSYLNEVEETERCVDQIDSSKDLHDQVQILIDNTPRVDK